MSRTLLADESYRALWLTQVGDAVDRAVRSVAVPWLVLALTGDPLQLGVAFALFSAPDVLLAPAIGYVIDEAPPRLTLGMGELVQGALVVSLGLLATAGRLTVPALYAGLVALAVFVGLTHNARRAVLPAVVGERALDEANAWLEVVLSILGLLSLLAGGVVVALVGPGTALVAGGVAPALASLAVVRLEVPDWTDADDRSGQGVLAGIAATTRAGIRTVRGRRTLLEILAFGIAVNLFVVPYASVLIPAASRNLGGALALTALLAGFKAGGLVGNVVAARVTWARKRKVVRGTALVGLASLGVATIGATVGAGPLSLALLVAGLFVAGLGQPLFNVPTSSLLQASAGQDGGTVVTFVNSSLQAVFPLPLLVAGALLRSVSPFYLFAAAGAGVVALAAVVAVSFEFG